MILAGCLNPAIDVTYHVAAHVPGQSHRVRSVTRRAGGKGVNVARVVRQLGEPVLVTGLLGGPTGAAIAADLAAAQLETAWVPIAAASRQTLTVVDAGGATGFNEPGPPVAESEWAAFLAVFAARVTEAAVVVLSGSLPDKVPETAYAELTRLAHESGAAVLVDADEIALRQALTARPDLVKPNAAEAGQLAGRPVFGSADAHAAARRAVELGARAAVVSLGPDGCIAHTESGGFVARPPSAVPGNPTGAGDALVAALACGLARRASWPELLAEATAVSAAAVAMSCAGGFDEALAERLRPGVRVERL